MPGCRGCVGARNRVTPAGVSAASASAATRRPHLKQIARPATARPARSARSATAAIPRHARPGTDRPAPHLFAPAKRAPVEVAPHFEAKVDPSTCLLPVVCGNSVSFCVTLPISDCFRVPESVELGYTATIAACDSGLRCNIIQCPQEIGVTLQNPCNPDDPLDIISCAATIVLNRVYVSGGIAAKVSMAVVPLSGCGIGSQTVDLTIPVDDTLICVSCGADQAFCPETLIADCQIDCVTALGTVPLVDDPQNTCDPDIACPSPIGAPPRLFAIQGTIFFNQQCGQVAGAGL